VIAFAALTGPLPKVGVVAVAVFAALALLARGRRWKALAMLGALVLSPVLLLSDIWSSPQLRLVHRHPLFALVGAVLALAVLAGAARLIARRPTVLAPLAVLALPFRVPIQAGGTTSNLLVPLYLVVAAGALAWLVPALREGSRPARPATGVVVEDEDGSGGWAVWVQRLLALYVVLYGLQSVYSSDFEKALQTMVFFYVPFALLYQLLRSLRWTPELVRNCLRLIIVLSVVFSAIGFVEYATKTIILNPKLVVANDLHTYFTVNSVFFDPDIFGRFLALAMILLAVLLLYQRPPREQLVTMVLLAILWVGLLLTLSRSSLGALLVGLGVLAALRWKPSRALMAAVVVIALGAVAVAASPRTFGLNQGINGASSGRGGLVSGGLSLFSERPVWGYGSGSFVDEYRAHHHATATTLSASHTIPITIAAEQGLIGELAYLALVIVALICLLRRARGDPVRGAIAAAFAALVFHTMLYADFLEDPVTWVLLGVGVSLAAGLPARAAAAVAGAGVGAGAGTHSSSDYTGVV
jgi:O-antigen ligase